MRRSWRRQGQLVDQAWQPDDTVAPLDRGVPEITRHAPAELFESRPFGFAQIAVAPAKAD